jgi:methionine-S-sulfoxide reductase
MKTEKAYFAAGCFWGVQYHLSKLQGVISSIVGFMGGELENPSYSQVKTGGTGHLETIEIIFDPNQISYEDLLRNFFEIHDFEQIDGQGPDLGTQYLSAIFFVDDNQRDVALKVFGMLLQKGYKVATQIRKDTIFYPAEDYHQNYYTKNNSEPYCHVRRKIF